MKKLLFTLSALSAISASSYASVAVALDDSHTTKEGAYVMDKADAYVLRIKDHSYDFQDYYLKLAVPEIYFGKADNTYVTIQSTGMIGTAQPGHRANYHIILGSDFATDAKNPFMVNNTTSASIGYYLEADTAVNLSVVDVADHSKLATMDLNLATKDADATTTWGTHGRTFSVGKNVTLKASTLNVSGKLTTDQTEDVVDSVFKVENAGAVEVTNLNLKGSNIHVENGGKFTASYKVDISNNSNLKIDGSVSAEGGTITIDKSKLEIGSTGSLSSIKINTSGSSEIIVNKGGELDILAGGSATYIGDSTTVTINGEASFGAGIQLGGTSSTTIGSTGVVSTTGLRLQGGSLHIDGKLQAYNGGNLTMNVNSGSMSVGANADLSKVLYLQLNSGAFNVTSDINASTTVLRTLENCTMAMSIDEGKKFTVHQSNFYKGSTTTVNGNLEITDGGYIQSTAVLNVASGTTTYGRTDILASSLDNNGTLNIAKGATVRVLKNATNDLQVNGSRAGLGGTINVNGGTISLEVNSENYNAIAGLITGNTTLTNGASINVSKTQDRIRLGIAEGGVLSVSADSKLNTNSIVFTRQTDKSDYKGEAKLILASGDSFVGNIVVLRKAGAVLELADGKGYMFNKLEFHDFAGGSYANEITIDLNGATRLNIGSVVAFSRTALGSLLIKDFQEGVVKIDNLTDAVLAEINTNGSAAIGGLTLSMNAVDANGNIIAGDWSLKDGFLSHSAFAVPEPAEWAMILGALALGFAIYRRRK